MLAKVISGATVGLNALPIEVEVDIAAQGLPAFTKVGTQYRFRFNLILTSKMLNTKMKTTEFKQRGSPSREVLYAEAAKYAPKAIQVLADLLEHSNENVRVSAAKAILAKAIPDLKATEISTLEQSHIKIALPSWALEEQS